MNIEFLIANLQGSTSLLRDYFQKIPLTEIVKT